MTDAAARRELAHAKGLYPAPASPGRSRNMAAIRRSNTKPEVVLRSLIHAAGLRYRVDFPIDLGSVKPRPDIVFTRAKLAVFVDGCFWHGCAEHSRTPQVNADYWGTKLRRNVERDRNCDAALVAAGWAVIRIWEHEDPVDAAQRIAAAVRG